MEENNRNVAMEFCEAAYMESIFAHIPFSPKYYQGILDNIVLEETQHFGMKAVQDSHVVGVIYYMVGGYFIGEGARLASLIMIKVASSVQNTMLDGKVALQLVRLVNEWAKASNVDVYMFHVTSGQNPSKTDRIFRKLRAATIGRNYGCSLSK